MNTVRGEQKKVLCFAKDLPRSWSDTVEADRRPSALHPRPGHTFLQACLPTGFFCILNSGKLQCSAYCTAESWRWKCVNSNRVSNVMRLCLNRERLGKGVIYVYLHVITRRQKTFVNCKLQWIIKEFFAKVRIPEIMLNRKGTLHVNTQIYV